MGFILMSEMINKVAEALCYAKPVTFEDMARIAIAAMREPTPSMLASTERMPLSVLTGRPFVGDIWETMIEEALK